ncbi:MAG TPA: hypothetical protein VE987_14425, partial [Polyangiaceae bacterium]|nr:hypothetical protein [Polyangiaceae bacterium]
SGAATSVVAISILLAFTAKGSSVVTAAIVARASVLFIAASIDVLFGKRIGVHVLLGCLLALASILLSTRYNGRFALSTATAVPLAVYMVAYTVRLAAVSRKAKSPEAHKNWSFFVGEHVATAVFLVLFGFLTSATMDGGAAGAAHVQRAAAGWLALLGFSAALVSVFSGLIYVAPQNNTFCVLASRCAGVVGSTAAGLILGLCSRGARGPSTEELAAVVLTLAATALLAAGERRNRATAPTRAAAADGGATLDAPMSFAAPAQPAAPEVMSVARTASGRPAFDQRGS